MGSSGSGTTQPRPGLRRSTTNRPRLCRRLMSRLTTPRSSVDQHALYIQSHSQPLTLSSSQPAPPLQPRQPIPTMRSSSKPSIGSAGSQSSPSRLRPRSRPLLASASILVSSVLITHPAHMTAAMAKPFSSNQDQFQPSFRRIKTASDAHLNSAKGKVKFDNVKDRESTSRLDPALDKTLANGIFDTSQHSSHGAIPDSKRNQVRDTASQVTLAADDVDDTIPNLETPFDAPQRRHSPTLTYPVSASTSKTLLRKRDAPSTTHRHYLPSSYPSTIVSSWSRPQRSVWFQQKTIIITSIFLAIFIVLFIGAAVFLRGRKLDDEEDYDGSQETMDQAELDRMKAERVQAGLNENGGGGDREKDATAPNNCAARKKKRLRLGRKRIPTPERTLTESSEGDPSFGSSSAVKRLRFPVSRWRKVSTGRRVFDSRETVCASDSASIRSSRSSRRVALPDPPAIQTVDIAYHRDDPGAISPDPNSHSSSQASARSRIEDDANHQNVSHFDSATRSSHSPSRDVGTGLSDTMAPANRSSSNLAPPVDDPARRTRLLLDQTDFQAAEAAESAGEAHHLPPSYVSSSHQAATSSLLAGNNPIASGDIKQDMPPPGHPSSTLIPSEPWNEDRTLPTDSTNAQPFPDSLVSPTVVAHLATDDKAILGALSAAASTPTGHAAGNLDDSSRLAGLVPAYVSNPLASSLNPGPNPSTPSAPSAPRVNIDREGFEVVDGSVMDHSAASGPRLVPCGNQECKSEDIKGKARQGLGILPAPPQPLEPTFSHFDQPYRHAPPPEALVCPGLLGGVGIDPPSNGSLDSPSESLHPPSVSHRSSAKQREAEMEMARLVSSSPADLLASSPAAVTGGSLQLMENLPAYEHCDSSEPRRQGGGGNSNAAAQPSAPPLELPLNSVSKDDALSIANHSCALPASLAGPLSTATAPSSPAPSAPPLFNTAPSL